MHSCYLLTALLSLCLISASAYEFSTAKLCTTKQSTKSISPVPTSSYVLTVYKTYSKTVTSTPTKTITPSVTILTATSTATSTTILETTATSTATTTTATTTTLTTSTTTTQTSTTVISVQGTSTIPTVAGFTPVASGVGFVPKKRSNLASEGRSLAIRGRPIDARAVSTLRLSINRGEVQCNPQIYPVAVVCGALVFARTTTTKTVSATKTATTTIATPTSSTTITTTATATVFSTVDETITTTQTVTSSTTTTKTFTDTITLTQTVTIPTATVYAACQSNNLVGAANGGKGIDALNPIFVGSEPLSTTDLLFTSDAVACCELNQQTTGSVGSAFYNGRCYIFTSTSCNPSLNATYFYTSHKYEANQAFFISNGPCGQLTNAGFDD